jgi:hypothetical protein
MVMRRDLILVGLTALLAIILWRWLFPPKVGERPIPTIITKYDTVTALPKWFADSMKRWKKTTVVHTTDTVNLVVSQTIVDTQFIPVDAPPEERPNVWPLLSYHGTTNWGDTATISTFSVRTGRLGISRVFIPGILTSIDSDSTATPQLTFEPFPKPRGVSLMQKITYATVGYGVCSIVNLVRP